MVFVFLLKKMKHLIIAREQMLFFEELTMHLIFFSKNDEALHFFNRNNNALDYFQKK